MNANELANLLEVDSWYKLVTREEIATMLRQQQAEIEALKQSKSDGNNKVNSEPVAWISVLGIDLIGQKFTDVRVSLTKTDVASIPLYTHPVKEQLTDEEIDAVGDKVSNLIDTYAGRREFARAILRKAQEK